MALWTTRLAKLERALRSGRETLAAKAVILLGSIIGSSGLRLSLEICEGSEFLGPLAKMTMLTSTKRRAEHQRR